MNLDTLREGHADTTLCPTCQRGSGLPLFHIQTPWYVQGHRTLAHLYTIPVLHDFEDIRNCPHCRASTGDWTCRVCKQARKGCRPCTERSGVSPGT